MTSETSIKIEMERILNASTARVYEVLTKAEHIPAWYGPSDAYKIKIHHWDCKVGGTYRVEFNTPEGENHIVVGEFKELRPNEKVSYTWSWEGQPPMDTLVTFKLTADGDKTKLDLLHDGFPSEEPRDHHTMGWTGSMDRLEKSV
ncbi:MAG: SRPBCC domain-containing protein [Planctomycetota bacterium]